jgi:hypothetical protein
LATSLSPRKLLSTISPQVYLREWQVPGAAPPNQVRLPIVTLEEIKVMCYWVHSQHRTRIEEDADDFDDEVAVAMLEIMQKAKDLKAMMEAVMIDKPMALTKLSKWTKFWLKFLTYIGCIHGASHIPLMYFIYEHEEVTNDIAAGDYNTADDDHLIHL